MIGSRFRAKIIHRVAGEPIPPAERRAPIPPPPEPGRPASFSRMPYRLLLAEDEPAIADTIRYAAETEGFTLRWCATCHDALAAFETEGADLLILDVGLPDGSGFDLCRSIRQRSEVPVVFLTARGDVIDRVVGLEIGGDDYMTKPFSPRELMARVRARLRRTPGPAQPSSGTGADSTEPAQEPAGADSPGRARQEGGAAAGSAGDGAHIPGLPAEGLAATLRRGAFLHDVERCRISYHGRALELARQEYRLLAALIEKPGRVWSREQLMERAWEEPMASLERTVDAHIRSLRAKIRAARPDADPIATHRGLGYSLREDC